MITARQSESAPTAVRMALSPIWLATLALLQAACSSMGGPDYERPDVETPSQFSSVSESAQDVVLPGWWQGFEDPYLNELIDRSIESNLDLRISVARVEEAGAAIGQARAAGLPSLSASTSVTRTGRNNPFEDRFESDGAYSGQSQLAWEIDTWGKLKKGVNSRRAAFRASEADWRAAYLATVAQVASAYFLIRQFDEQTGIQQDAYSAAQSILEIYQQQANEGLVPNTTVLRQEAELNNLKRGQLDIQRQRDIAELALSTMLGIPAGNLKIPPAPLTTTVKELPIPAGLPADLLSRRPDIVAAEYRVLEAHELIGQAELARLPSISLTGNTNGGGDLASASLSSFIKSFTFGIGPSINIPIFDPNVRSRIKTSKASAKTSEATYRKVVMAAFEEVERSLVNIASRQAQKQQLLREVSNLKTVAQQMQAQLQVGLVSQLEVFESQRRLLASHQSLLDIHQRVLSDTVTLYKALGGGWDETVVSVDSL